MKKYAFWLFCISLLAIGFTACSEDNGSGDDGGDGPAVTLQAPPFEDIAALYEVETDGSGIKSIELTEGGLYIITKNAPAAYQVIRKRVFWHSEPQVRAIEYGNIITGTYTKVSDVEYALEGYGTLKVNVWDDENPTKIATVTLYPIDGDEIAVDVIAKEPVSTSDLTQKLCRTWIPETMVEKEWEDGVLVWHADYNYSTKQVVAHVTTDGEYYEEDWLEKVIFSKAGTYTCFFDDGCVDITNWRWADESQGVLEYYFSDEAGDGVVEEGVVDVPGAVPSEPDMEELKKTVINGVEYDEVDVVKMEFFNNKMKMVETSVEQWDGSPVYERYTEYILRSAN